MKKYKIIYADPPWDYGGRKLNVSSKGKELNDHYSTMKHQDICNLPIKELSDKNCLLFLWVTYPHLEKSFEVIRAWGFKYSTVVFEWLKMTSTGKNVCFMGVWTTGGGIELCLLAHKGSVPRISKNIRKMIISERKRHSEKPPETRERIVALVGDLPRIELFARQKTEGWDVWGNEVESDIKL
jgi:N6-adenosine-specific RNA methylase IME4